MHTLRKLSLRNQKSMRILDSPVSGASFLSNVTSEDNKCQSAFLSLSPGSSHSALQQGDTKSILGTRSHEFLVTFTGSKQVINLHAQRVLAVMDECLRAALICHMCSHIMSDLEDTKTLRIALGRQLVEELTLYTRIFRDFVTVFRKWCCAKEFPMPDEDVTPELISLVSLMDDNSALGFWKKPIDDIRREKTAAHSKLLLNRAPVFSEKQIEHFKKNVATIEHDLQKLRVNLKHHLRCVIRLFRENPTAFAAVAELAEQVNKHQSVQSKGTFQILEQLKIMRHLMFQRLLVSVDEENKTKTTYKQKLENLHQVQETIPQFEAQLAETQTQMYTRMDLKSDLETQLYKQYLFLNSSSENRQKETKTLCAAECRKVMNDSREKQAKLIEEKNALQQKLSKLSDIHQESEAKLRRRKFVTENEIESFIQKYDERMESLQGQFDKETEEFDTIQENMKIFEQRISELTDEYKNVLERRRIAEQKRIADEEERALKLRSAITIQAYWRSFKTRRVLRAQRAAKRKQGNRPF